MVAEQQLLDMLYRIESMKDEAAAVRIQLSALKPPNRAPNRIRMTMTFLEELVTKSRSRVFLLSDTDIFIIGRNIPGPLLEKAAQKIRSLFQSDPFFSSEQAGDFIRIHPLKNEYETVLNIAREKEEAYRNDKKQKETKQPLIPIAPEHLDTILRNIEGFNILKVIRRQEATQITRSGRYYSLFHEYFTSMADLKAAIAPDVDVLSNRWLFQHLSETLDKRMLSVDQDLFSHTPRNISLNLNISTIFTPAFETFLNRLPEAASVVVEVQLMDIIQNTKNFMIAKDLLRGSGHRLLIDGLHPISLEFLDIDLLDPDFLKLNWSPSVPEYNGRTPLPQMIRDINPERIILMRCEDENAIKWGLSQGITRFQGYFIDALSGAGTRRKCKKSDACTMAQCIARKACIAGPLRRECLCPEALDEPIEANL